jgi:hypothetical protein
MSVYRVKVESYVAVTARTAQDAKARAELSLRRAVLQSYDSELRSEAELWADGWERFSFQAKRAEKVGDDD